MSIFDRFSDRIEDFVDEVFIPEQLRSLLGRASRLLERENYDQALTLLERARDEYEPHHRTFHFLGVCQFFRQQYREAREALERAIELRDEPASRLYAGLAAEKLGAARDAKLHFQAALTSSENVPFEGDLHLAHGRVLMDLGRPEKALHELRKAERLDVGEPEVTIQLARALVECGDIDEASRRLDEIPEEELGPESTLLAARVAEARGEHPRAAELYEEVLEDLPERVEALMGAARNHLRAGAPARAQQYLLRAIDEAGDGGDRLGARVLLGRAQEKVGDLEAAREYFAAAVDSLDDRGSADRRRAAEARLGLGRTALKLGEPEVAEAQFEALVPSAPAGIRDEARLGLAKCRLQSEQYAEARRLLEDIDPDRLDEELRAERFHLAGRVALRSGDAAEALVALQEALHSADAPAEKQAVEESRLEALRELKPDWDLPASIDGPIAAERVIDRVREFMTADPRLEAFVPRIQDLAEAMNRPLSVAIVGEFNAGKSTLVNALLGEEVVPTGVLPTTAHTCYIRYGPRKTARVHYRTEPDSEDWTADADPGEVVEAAFDEARKRMDEDADEIDHLEFLYPHPQLRSIHFRDTPGFNALDGDDDTAAAALDDAEAVLWVFDAGQTLSRTEFDRLTAIPESRDRLVVLLNKVDELGDDDVAELEAHVDETIGAEIAGQFAISAREAFRRATGEADSGEEGRFGEFREFLDRRFVQRAGRIKTLEARRRLGTLVEDLDEHVDRLGERYDSLGELAEELSDWVDRRAEDRVDERVERETETIDDQFQFAVTAVAREIREDLRPRGTFFSRMTLDDEDREFALELLRGRLRDVLERSEERVRTDVAEFENELDARIGAILDALDLANTRSLNRRLEGLHDEFDALRRLLSERVYGRLAANLTGRLDAAGAEALAGIEPDDPEDLEPWRTPLAALLPPASDHVDEHLTDWYREFFVAARRFSDRITRDLELVRLEAEYRYDLSPLRDLLSSP